MSTSTTNLIDGTAQNFDEIVLASDRPVLVDFTASWCPPCRLLKPVMEDLADELIDQVRVVAVDVDAEQTLASQYGIQSIPAIRVFKGGQIVAQETGFRSREDLLALLERSVPSSSVE